MSSGRYILTGGDVPGEGNACASANCGIPPALLGQLWSGKEDAVIASVDTLVSGNYSRDEVCEAFAGMLLKGAVGKVASKVSDGLVLVVSQANPVISARTINRNLHVVNDTNGLTLSKIAAEPLIGGEVRHAAIELLSRYREGDIGRETLENIERLMTSVAFNEKDDPRIRRSVESTFARRSWRPNIETPSIKRQSGKPPKAFPSAHPVSPIEGARKTSREPVPQK